MADPANMPGPSWAGGHRGPDPSDVGDLSRWLTASGPPAPLTVPFDGSVGGYLPTSTPGDVDAAAARARRVRPGWASRPLGERAEVLLRFHDRLLTRRNAFVDLVQTEAGKSRLSAVEEVLHVALTARYYARTAGRALREQRGSGLFPVLTRIDKNYRPKGLVGVIGPWNYPFSMTISDALPALVAGNAVLIKPDAQTPRVTLAAVALLEACGLPPGLAGVVHGPGAEVGPLLIDASDYVCFTGSTATGRLVAARCAGRLIGCSLELGGKNPLLVLDDANLRKAAAGAVRACFANAGQLCVSMERIYVAEPLLEPFCAELAARTRALTLGTGWDYRADVGCLINVQQVQRVSAHVEDAVAQGATVLAGGRARPDLGALFYEPTVLTGVRPGMQCFADETFGPVVSVYPARDDDDAVTQANASPYGLNASVWTTDPARGRRVAARLDCGTVNVNEGFAASFGSLDAPMGGMKNSGLGRRQGREGILRYVEVQSIATQSGVPLAPSLGLPPAAFATGVTGVLRLLRRLGRA